MAEDLVIEDDFGTLRLAAGFDAAYSGRRGFGGLVVWDLEAAEVVETVQVETRVDVPYVPGFLSYREFPILAAAWRAARAPVDLLMVDGAGLMHPRHLGSACFAGLKLDVPSIGVTKNLFVGEVGGVLEKPGDVAPVRHEGRLTGYAFRPRKAPVKVIYVSPGHRVSPQTALELVRRTMGRHKLPDPIRLAHEAAGAAKRAALG